MDFLTFLTVLQALPTLVQIASNCPDDVVERAVTECAGRHRLLGSELKKAARLWIRDEDVLRLLANIQLGHEAPPLAPVLVERFRALSDQGFTEDLAIKFLAEFLQTLDRELAQGRDGVWRLQQEQRHSNAEVLSEVRSLKDRLPLPGVALPTSGDRSENTAIEVANGLFNDGRIDAAKETYLHILDRLSGPVEPHLGYRLHLNLAACAITQDDWTTANKHLSQAIDYKPCDPKAYAQLAQVALHEDEYEQAASYARKALSEDEENEVAWLVMVQLPQITVAELPVPDAVQSKHDYWLCLATRALRERDPRQTVTYATECLRRSSRAAGTLVAIAELLHCAYYSQELENDRLVGHADVLRLSVEAAEKAEKGRRLDQLSRALVMQGAAFLAMERDEEAASAFHRATRLNPSEDSARYGLARAMAELHQFAESLGVCDTIPPQDRTARVLALRARLLSQLERPADEVEAAVSKGVAAALGEPDHTELILQLSDAALRAELAELATSLLVGEGEQPNSSMYWVLRGRLAFLRGDVISMAQCYCRAEEASASARYSTEIRYEWASHLVLMGEEEEALAVFARTEITAAPIPVKSAYAQALEATNDWVTLDQLLRTMEDQEPLPIWGLQLAGTIALRCDDMPKALECLTELIRQGKTSSQVELHRAYCFVKMGNYGPAADMLHEMVVTGRLSAEEQLATARLLFECRRFELAREAAYAAYLAAPASPDVRNGFVGIMLQSPDNELVPADAVSIGSAVRLRSARTGKLVTYYISARESAIPYLLSPQSPEAALLLGRRVGETLPLRPADIEPELFEVTEILPEIVAAMQDVLVSFQTQIDSGSRSFLQSVPTGDPESAGFFMPVLALLHRQDSSDEWLLERYREQMLPMGVFAGVKGGSLWKTARYITFGTSERFQVESGHPTDLANATRAAMSDEPVVVSTVALHTLSELNLLRLLPALYSDIRVPQSSYDELRHEISSLRLDIDRGGAARLGHGQTGLEFHEYPSHYVQLEVDRLSGLLDFIGVHCSITPRPVEALLEAKDLQEAIGTTSMDLLLSVSKNVRLYADDAGLGRIAVIRQATYFSTRAVLDAALAHGALDSAGHFAAAEQLIKLRHSFLPISADFMYRVLREEAYSAGPRFRRVAERLDPKLCSADTVVAVAAALFRQIALSPLGGGALEGVIKVVLDVLLPESASESSAVLRMLDARVNQSMGLLPIQLDEYRQVREDFLKIRDVAA